MILGIIPARYASRRLPGKLLKKINGKSIIQYVYERANQSTKLDKLIVATDDLRIKEEIKSINGNVIMTSPERRNGTERCAQAASKYQATLVINIQGDQVTIEPSQIDELVDLAMSSGEISTLATTIHDDSKFSNPSTVKVSIDDEGHATAFKRITEVDNRKWFKHIGIYAYPEGLLFEVADLKATSSEMEHSLEQLRWTDNGYSIQVGLTKDNPLSIDDSQDLTTLEKKL